MHAANLAWHDPTGDRAGPPPADPLPAGAWSLFICLLGTFRVLSVGHPVALRRGSKTQALLSLLAIHAAGGLPRETVLEALWPESDPALAGQALNSLVYSMHKALGSVLGGAPVVLVEGGYRLNLDAGVGVDLVCFEALAAAGDRHTAAGNPAAATGAYTRAVDLYCGDLCGSAEGYVAIQRERLRNRYLRLLARLAEGHYAHEDYGACLEYALRLLSSEPCREDAHRLIMRCYMRQGDRIQALRQYRLCEGLLQSEFGMAPEPATVALYEQVRRDPSSI